MIAIGKVRRAIRGVRASVLSCPDIDRAEKARMIAVLDALSATLQRHYDPRFRPSDWIKRVIKTPDIASDAMIVVRNYEAAVALYRYRTRKESSAKPSPR